MAIRKVSIVGLSLAMLVMLASSGVAVEPVAPTLVAPPDGFQAIGPGSGILKLVWEEVQDASAYEVRVTQPTGEFQDFLRITRHSSIPFGGVREGTFEWQVRCVYADPEVESVSRPERLFGPWSETWSFGIVRPATDDFNPQAPPAPRVLFPQNGTVLIQGNDYLFKWTPVNGAFQYQIDLLTPRGPIKKIVPLPFWKFRGTVWGGPMGMHLPPEGEYVFRVRAVGRFGRGRWSAPVTFQFKYDGDHTPWWHAGICNVTPPVLIAPEDGAVFPPLSEGLVGIFSWEKVDSAEYYEIVFKEIQPRFGPHWANNDTQARQLPPTSALVEDTTYALVIPDATPGDQFVWHVRAIVKQILVDQERLVPTAFSQPRKFTIGPVSPRDEVGEPIVLLAPRNGAVFSGPEASVPFAWLERDRNRICQVTVTDATGHVVAQHYCRGNRWNANIAGLGEYQWQVRGVEIGQNGEVTKVGPASQKRKFEINTAVIFDGGRPVGDLVNDGSVDSGDAVRALRHSTDQQNIRLRVEDISAGDCNGDGRVDSGDAVYMLRKAVGSNR